MHAQDPVADYDRTAFSLAAEPGTVAGPATGVDNARVQCLVLSLAPVAAAICGHSTGYRWRRVLV
jgi:hypothetical protein